jgi:hypothetical protein
MTHVMWNPWKRTFTLTPMFLLTVISPYGYNPFWLLLIVHGYVLNPLTIGHCKLAVVIGYWLSSFYWYVNHKNIMIYFLKPF